MGDGAGILEGADAFDALLAADTRRFHAAKGSAQVETGGAVVVDPDVAANELAPDAIGRVGIGRPNRTAETGPAIVRHTDRFLFGVKWDHRNYRAKLLFRHDAQLEIRIDDDGRAHEVPALHVS